MKLYWAEVLNPRKVCALAKHLDLPLTFVKVDLARRGHLSPEFRALNPNCKVPVLDDGGRLLWETDAILCHLARRAGSDLWPHDERQVDVIRWMSWNQGHFQPQAGTFYFEHVIKPQFGLGPPDAAKLARAEKPFKTFAAVLDAHLASHNWLVGDAPTIADFTVSAALPWAAEAKLPLDGFPAILRWRDRLMDLPAWRDPYPD